MRVEQPSYALERDLLRRIYVHPPRHDGVLRDYYNLYVSTSSREAVRRACIHVNELEPKMRRTAAAARASRARTLPLRARAAAAGHHRVPLAFEFS